MKNQCMFYNYFIVMSPKGQLGPARMSTDKRPIATFSAGGRISNGIDSILASFSVMLARTVYHCTISSARQSVAIRRLKKEVKQINEEF